MKKNKKAISIVEAIVVVAVIALGLVGVYKLYTNSIRFLDGVEAKIQATQIAREGLEAVENIRDTNWLLFASDTPNCWRVLDYDAGCIGNINANKMGGNTVGNSVTYKVYRDGNRWKLTEDSGISTFFNVGLDKNGFYTQIKTDFEVNKYMNVKQFTRKIEIVPGVDLKEINKNLGKVETQANSENGITVKSIVEWKDSSSSKRRKVELINVLTNYKK